MKKGGKANGGGAERKMKRRYEVPRMDSESVTVRTHMLTLSDGTVGTRVEHDAVENVFVKGSAGQSLWDRQW